MPNGSYTTIHFAKDPSTDRSSAPKTSPHFLPGQQNKCFSSCSALFCLFLACLWVVFLLLVWVRRGIQETSPYTPMQPPPSHVCLEPRVCLGLLRPGGEVLPPLDSLLGAHQFPAQHRSVLQCRGEQNVCTRGARTPSPSPASPSPL